jgi:hypothetical protein
MENMNKLNELLLICSKNKVEFIYQHEGEENTIIFQPTIPCLTVNIVDYEDENLENLFSERIKELNELFK